MRDLAITNPGQQQISIGPEGRHSAFLVPLFLSEMERKDLDADIEEFIENIQWKREAAQRAAWCFRASCLAGAVLLAVCGFVDGSVLGNGTGAISSLLVAGLVLAYGIEIRFGFTKRAATYHWIAAQSEGFLARFRGYYTDGQKLEEYDRFLSFRKETGNLVL